MIATRRARITIVVLAVSLVLSLSATTIIAIAWSRDRAASRQALADAQTRIHLLEAATGKTAQPSNSAAPSPTATPVTSTSPAATTGPSAASISWPYARMTHLTDNLGHDWIYGPDAAGSRPIVVKVGSTVTFTAYANDLQSRPLEYEFWDGDDPVVEVLLCGWGGPACVWKAGQMGVSQYGGHHIHVAVRVAGSDTGRLSACFKIVPCDDTMFVPFETV